MIWIRPATPLLLVTVLAFASSPTDAARAGQTVTGSARDRDTNEPIAGAWIFETLRDPGSGADVFHVERVRTKRTDAAGAFSFESPTRLFEFGRSYAPIYQFFHPSYGLVRARADSKGPTVTIRPSLRDAHLRQADATAFCNASVRNEMVEKMAELACPPERMLRFEDGSKRAEGPRDERGRRDGEWTFHREDGSVIARGRYRAGAAIGDWSFESPPAPGAHDTETESRLRAPRPARDGLD